MKILGITHPVGSDTSACLIDDGKVVGLYEEERFSRQKHALNSVPKNAIDHLLLDAQLTLADIDRISVGFTRPSNNIHSQLSPRLAKFLGNLHSLYDFHTHRLECSYLRLDYVDHYTAHALSIAPYFVDREANILILDGWGGDASGAAMFLDSAGGIRKLWQIPISHSLGIFFQLITQYIGFQPHADEGKTMGLASYGIIDERTLPDFCDQSTGLPELERYLEYLDKLSFKRSAYDPILASHKNLAATAQYYLERAVLLCAKRIFRETGCPNFGLAGGVALNCVSNGKLANLEFIEEIFIQPAANDSGVALGAAVALSDKLPSLPRDHVFLGPNYTLQEINLALQFSKVSLCDAIDPVITAVHALMKGDVIAIYQGRAEIGPRALGARSILADPRSKSMQDKVNQQVKRRECWRPFAPSVLEEYAGDIFGAASPFMTISDTVNEAWLNKIPATVHVDGTARAQLIPEKSDTLLAKIVRLFFQYTGVPVLLNTSFNLNDEPMVNRPDHAIATFYRSGIDMLVFEHGVLIKK